MCCLPCQMQIASVAHFFASVPLVPAQPVRDFFLSVPRSDSWYTNDSRQCHHGSFRHLQISVAPRIFGLSLRGAHDVNIASTALSCAKASSKVLSIANETLLCPAYSISFTCSPHSKSRQRVVTGISSTAVRIAQKTNLPNLPGTV